MPHSPEIMEAINNIIGAVYSPFDSGLSSIRSQELPRVKPSSIRGGKAAIGGFLRYRPWLEVARGMEIGLQRRDALLKKFASDPSGVLLGLEDHDFRVSEIRKVLQQASRDDISDAFAEWSNSDRIDMVFRILGCASDELAMAQLLDSLPIEQRRNFYTLLWSRFSDLNLEDALLQAEGRGE